MRRFLSMIWGSVEEPRAVTLVMMVAYLVSVGTGIATITLPSPNPIPSAARTFQILIVAMLTVGGLVGLPAAWTGKWWLERPAATVCLGGSVVSLFEVLAIVLIPEAPHLMAPVLTTSSAMFGVLLFTSRLFRISRLPYAPGKGPQPPQVEAAHLLSKMIVEERQALQRDR